MAERIAGSRLLEVGRFDWLPYREIAEFIVDAWEQRAVERRRVLATVLFTDLVDSTADGAGIRRRLARAAGRAQRGHPARARALPRRDDRHRRRRVLRLRLRRPRPRHPLRVRDPRRRRLARPRYPRRRPHGRVRRRRRQARRSRRRRRRPRRRPRRRRRGARLGHGEGPRRRLGDRLRRPRPQRAQGPRRVAALRRRRPGLGRVFLELRKVVGDLEPGAPSSRRRCAPSAGCSGRRSSDPMPTCT